MIGRVLFASPWVHFPQGGGGAERNTHELCLAAAGPRGRARRVVRSRPG